MRKIRLGASGVECSVMGLGCMGMSEFYGAHDDTESLKTLERAFELGVTHYDTSNVYGKGANERLVGRFAKDKRDRVVIASKFGVVRDPDGPEGSTYDRGIDNAPDYMRQCCDESLKRLGTDHIDLYYVHRVDPKQPIEVTMGALADLVKQGKIRAIGLSEVSAQQLRQAHAVHPVAALQSEYSLWSRELENDVIPTCRELGITFVAYSPLGRGFLTGAIQKPENLAPDDIRHTSPRFQGENFVRNQALVQRITDFADARGYTASQIALAWVLHQGKDMLPIPGTKRIKYLEQNVAAEQINLSPAELAALNDMFPLGAAAGLRYDPNYKGTPPKAEAS
jgi:aryl-alcohol dehydrogenase-like predicted oxidoreductase